MKYALRFTSISALCAAVALNVTAAEPAGYYSSCEGKCGAALLSQLRSVVGPHTNVGYDNLNELYLTSDAYPDGTLWDMYSTKRWNPSSKCGNYKVVGDCYNKEHSFPKSWFGGKVNPMYADAYHIYPTDGKVNGQRSNYPYGECSGGQPLDPNGDVKPLGRLGSSTFSGYSGTVFEPDDQYKGDFARSYFYMAAAYNDKISGWSSEMLAGNAWPAFKDWSVKLLLKWHEQDPVSQKELDRNEAVYAAQKNRNPFIDHPDLVDHIWGDKKTTGWKKGADTTDPNPTDPTPTPEPKLLLPVDGSTVNLGTTMPGVSRTATVTVRGTDLTEDVSIAISGQGFSASPTSVKASAANTVDGAAVTVSFNPAQEGNFGGTITVKSGTLSRTVYLRGEAISTIPAGPVTAVSATGFEATWAYVGDESTSGTYTLFVTEGGTAVDGYPKQVKASDEAYWVENLEPETEYAYYVKSQNLTSQTVKVVTRDAIADINVLFDGELVFYTYAGEPSDEAELLLEIQNIYETITCNVSAPFQLSTDKSTWSTRISIDPEEDRIYLRIYSENPGTFGGSLILAAGDYYNDDVDFTGIVETVDAYTETFEPVDNDVANYDGNIYSGSFADWNLSDAGIWPGDPCHGGNQAVRFGMTAESSAEMMDNTPGGIGTVTLWAAKWAGDKDAEISLEYSADGGKTWTEAGTAAVKATDYNRFIFVVNSSSPARLRVRQTAGQRMMLDDIEAKPYSALIPDEVADYHRWDAFCRDGRLTIETTETVFAHVYALDATEVFAGRVTPGTVMLALTPGLYIVSVDDFARRVLVK